MIRIEPFSTDSNPIFNDIALIVPIGSGSLQWQLFKWMRYIVKFVIMKTSFIIIRKSSIWSFLLFMFNIMTLALFCISFASVSYASINMEPYYEVGFKDGNTWTIRMNGVTHSTSILPGVVYINGVSTKVLLQTGGEYSGSKEYQSMDDTGFYLHRVYAPDVYLEGFGFADITTTLIPPLKQSDKIVDIGQLIQSTGTAHYEVSGSTPITFDVDYDYEFKAVGYENVTVPFGNFFALKVQRSLAFSGWVGGEYFSSLTTSTGWVIPHLGSVKGVSLNDQGETEVYELVDTNIPFEQIDSDSDDFPNGQDAFPYDPNEWIDTDNDGIGDNADTDDDGDGMPDGWEVAYSLNPLVNDAADDPDGDGLSNLQEYQNNTNPENSDTDADGLKDGWEVSYGLDPVATNESQQDPDNDSLNNIEEQNYGTNPLLADSDGDGCSDGSEILGGRNPNLSDPQGDLDLDCTIDLEDAIIALQVMTGTASAAAVHIEADVNNDGKIGLQEVVYILQEVSGLR